jgi:DNA ligase (NAD+)
MEKVLRVNKLRDEIVKANLLYRQGTPIMEDEEFDRLEAELRSLSPDDEWFKKGVNDEKPKERAYTLPHPMMSLDKVKTIDALLAWAGKFPKATFIITPKYDGLSIGISSDAAWTRGDGTVGQLCTAHVKNASYKPVIEDNDIIRGEIIIANRDWKKFKKRNVTAKSQRNSATGLINGDYDAERLEDYKLLSIMPYEIMGSNLNKDKQLTKYYNSEYSKIRDINMINEKFLFDLFNKWRKNFPIDGLVIDVNESEYRNGVEANGNPSYTIAYKHNSFSERKDGIIDRIERSINRNGVITPVVVLKDAINISGADILKVSAINMRYVKDWGLYPDTKVTIVRSGEVIPKIVSVENVDIPFREDFQDNAKYELVYTSAVQLRQMQMMHYGFNPKTGSTEMMTFNNHDYLFETCPICGDKIEKVTNDKGEWCEMICTNLSCQGRLYGRISKFFEICGIDGFGEKTFNSLIDNGMIESSFFEPFYLKPSDFDGLDGWGEKSIEKFFNELERIRRGNLPVARFLHATGWFSDLGEKTIQKIIDADGWLRPEKTLLEIDGVQEITANKFWKGVMSYVENMEEIDKLFTFKYWETPKEEGRFSGMVFCMTGFRDKELSEKIIELGGSVSDGVTKETTCLIVKDITSNSSKVQKARKNGIEIIDRETFLQIYL